MIKLSDSEIKICEWLAKSRYKNNRKENIFDKKIGPQSCEITDLDGVFGEFAFCKAFNLYPDMSIEPRKGGFDLLWNGYKIDIKTTRYKTGKLLATKDKKLEDSDIYVLITSSHNNFTIAGWCYCEELIKKSNLVDLGYGLTYCLPQEKLRDISKITSIV
jgi:hypothetical protein